jgi:uncharacterized repeat protein (TIGR01451 family)
MVAVNVTAPAAGTFSNLSGPVSSSNGGAGNTATARLTVVSAPPSLAMAFKPNPAPVGTTSKLTFTITNPIVNSVALAGVAFSDTLPSGLVVADPSGLSNNCGGTATPTAGGSSISLSGGTIAVGASCTVAVDVNTTKTGTFTNTSGPVSSTNGGTGNTATATLNVVVAPPSLAMAFNPSRVAVNGTSTLTVTVTNPGANSVELTGVAFSDTLPSGLVVADPSGLSNNCGGTATAGASLISLSGGTIAVGASCTVAVDVNTTKIGTFTNTSGAVSSTNGGTGNIATATVTVTHGPGSGPRAELAFSPAALRFGQQPEQTLARPRMLKVTNNGTAPLVISSLTFVGAEAQDFVITSDRCLRAIDAGDSCTLSVSFAPRGEGARAAKLQIASNDAKSPARVPLSGTGARRVLRPPPRGRAIDFVVCHEVAIRGVGQGQGKRPQPAVREHCVRRLVFGTIKFTITYGEFAASLKRGRLAYASGYAIPTRSGDWLLVLKDRRTIQSGRYALTLRRRHGRGWITHHLEIRIG